MQAWTLDVENGLRRSPLDMAIVLRSEKKKRRAKPRAKAEESATKAHRHLAEPITEQMGVPEAKWVPASDAGRAFHSHRNYSDDIR